MKSERHHTRDVMWLFLGVILILFFLLGNQGCPIPSQPNLRDGKLHTRTRRPPIEAAGFFMKIQ